VETGTYLGNTTFWAASYFKNVYTIEISPEISKKTASKSGCPKNIEFIIGDSRNEIPKVVDKLQGRTIFWLDGHWCSGAGGKENECPLIEELKAISKCDKPIILIDDARCFLGPLPPPHNSSDWPTIDEIILLCGQLFSNCFTTIIDDVIVCVPEDVKPVIFDYWQSTFNERFAPVTSTEKKSLVEKIVSKSYHILKNRIHRTPPTAQEIEEMNRVRFFNRNKWLAEKKFKSIIDIGANIGQFAKKAKWLFPDAKLYSFEPIPFVYEELKNNFKDDCNFRAFNCALGDEEGETSFYLNGFSDSSSMLKMTDVHKDNFPITFNEQSINVEIKKLDNVMSVNQIEKPYLVKLDVQGYEEKVIRGGENIISNADFIITEDSFAELYEKQPLFNDIYNLLKSLGFQYVGNFEQLYSETSGEILQADAMFSKIK